MGILDKIFKKEEAEDDGIRIYDENMYLLCTRCRTQMEHYYDETKNRDYAECPNCGYIEWDDIEDDEEDTEYKDYWEEHDEDDDEVRENYDFFGDD